MSFHSVLILAAACTSATWNTHSIPPVLSAVIPHTYKTNECLTGIGLRNICHMSTERLSRTEKETLLTFQSNGRGVSELICCFFHNWSKVSKWENTFNYGTCFPVLILHIPIVVVCFSILFKPARFLKILTFFLYRDATIEELPPRELPPPTGQNTPGMATRGSQLLLDFIFLWTHWLALSWLWMRPGHLALPQFAVQN